MKFARRLTLPHRRRSPLTWLAVALLAILVLEPTLRVTRRFAVARPAAELDAPFYSSCREPDVNAPRERAALIMLARNTDVAAARSSVERIERHFNRWFHYPFVFLNNEPWSDEFRDTMRGAIGGGDPARDVRFEVLPNGTWGFPEGVDVDAARASMRAQESSGLRYGGVEGYHHMCRFFSG
jgi:mannosyltransferase